MFHALTVCELGQCRFELQGQSIEVAIAGMAWTGSDRLGGRWLVVAG